MAKNDGRRAASGGCGRPLRANLHECLWRTLRATRTDPKDAATGLRRVRFHDLRHSFASNLVSAGVPIVQVQHWLGHSTVSTTEIYAHLAPHTHDHLIAVLDAAPSERKLALAS